MQTVIVTGANGFVGKHLVRELDSQDIEVIGVGREKSAHSEIADLLTGYWDCDLTDKAAVNELPWSKASAVIGLAGLAQVGDSFANPEKYKTVNVAVLANICEYFAAHQLSARVVAVSTGAVYDTKQPMPLTEASKITSSGSPYAESKILMEKAAEEYRDQGVNIIVARPFNHIGPGQEPGFLVPDLYRKIRTAKASGSEIKVGNLETRRDYTDVRDVVRAYSSLALATPAELSTTVYNICSGVSRSGEEVLDEFKKHVFGLDEIPVVVNESLIRPNDPMELVGSSQLLQRDTSWRPQISFEQTIDDFVAGQTS